MDIKKSYLDSTFGLPRLSAAGLRMGLCKYSFSQALKFGQKGEGFQFYPYEKTRTQKRTDARKLLYNVKNTSTA